MLEAVSEPLDEKVIEHELCYLLHVRKIGKEYERSSSNLQNQLLELMTNFNAYTMNYRVLVVLIETGYCQQVLNRFDKPIYPKFLITVLNNSDRNYIKEACCRMIIKFFGKKKDREGGRDGGQGGDNDADAGKIEFGDLVEPLTSIISR